MRQVQRLMYLPNKNRKMKIKKFLLTALFVLCPVLAFAQQSLVDLNFINSMDNKKRATFGDAIRFIALDIGERYPDFESTLSFLKRVNIVKNDYSNLTASTPLRKGVLARMIARYLKLNDSLMYDIFRTERYAFRACAAENLMPLNGSEWDIVSGAELIEIMRRVSVTAEEVYNLSRFCIVCESEEND